MVKRPVEFDDEHRIFVQGIMCKGILNQKEVTALHEKALKACNIEIPEKKVEKQELLVKMMTVINDSLEKVGMVVRKGVDEDTGDSFFMLVNTQERTTASGGTDLARKVQGQWSAAELEYLRLLATEMLQSESKTITCTTALNLTRNVAGKALTMQEAEKTINKLMLGKWLKQLPREQFALGVRFLGEMEGWMSDVLEGAVTKCPTCRKVVVRGSDCHNCDSIYHKFCLNRQARAAREAGGKLNCKKCKAELPVAGEEGGSSGKRREEEEGGSSQQSQANGRERRRERQDEDEEEGESSQANGRERRRQREGEAGPSGTQKGRRISSRATESDSD